MIYTKPNFTVEWTGKWPCLCHGEWRIKVDGVDYSWVIPEDLRDRPMNTCGTYQAWHFENWNDVWESYESGLECEDWIAKNSWVNVLPIEPEEAFLAFQACDWRHGSCGGCI